MTSNFNPYQTRRASVLSDDDDDDDDGSSSDDDDGCSSKVSELSSALSFDFKSSECLMPSLEDWGGGSDDDNDDPYTTTDDDEDNDAANDEFTESGSQFGDFTEEHRMSKLVSQFTKVIEEEEKFIALYKKQKEEQKQQSLQAGEDLDSSRRKLTASGFSFHKAKMVRMLSSRAVQKEICPTEPDVDELSVVFSVCTTHTERSNKSAASAVSQTAQRLLERLGDPNDIDHSVSRELKSLSPEELATRFVELQQALAQKKRKEKRRRKRRKKKAEKKRKKKEKRKKKHSSSSSRSGRSRSGKSRSGHDKKRSKSSKARREKEETIVLDMYGGDSGASAVPSQTTSVLRDSGTSHPRSILRSSTSSSHLSAPKKSILKTSSSNLTASSMKSTGPSTEVLVNHLGEHYEFSGRQQYDVYDSMVSSMTAATTTAAPALTNSTASSSSTNGASHHHHASSSSSQVMSSPVPTRPRLKLLSAKSPRALVKRLMNVRRLSTSTGNNTTTSS